MVLGAITVIVVISTFGIGVIMVTSPVIQQWEQDQQQQWEQDHGTNQPPKETSTTGGDPIIFGNITYDKQFPDQKHWDTVCWFDFTGSGEKEFCARNMIGTMTVGIDNDGDGRFTTGDEIFWSLTKTSYEVAMQYDSNHNYWLDPKDDRYDDIMVTDFIGMYTLEELGIKSVHLLPDRTFENDCFGVGIYANPDTYVKDWAYDLCVKNGGYVNTEYIMPNDIRIVATNYDGIKMLDGNTVDTVAAVQGYWK